MPYETIDESSQFRTILLKGMSGTGKTYKAAHFPKPVIFNWDNNISGLRNLPDNIRKGIRILNPSKDFKSGKEINTKLQPGGIWANFVTQLEAVSSDDTVGTIILDSITTMAEALFDKILGTTDPNKRIEIQHWGDFQRYLKWLGDELLCAPTLDKHVIFIAHESYDRDEMTQKLLFTLNLGGKMKTGFDLYFSDVWRCYIKELSSPPSYMIRTVGGGNFSAKNSFKDLPVDLVWDEWKDKILAQL